MIRHLKILDYALSSLWRRKGKNAAILAAFTVTVGILASILFLTRSLEEEAHLLLRDAPDLVVQRLAAGRHDLIPAGYTERIRALRGVSGATPRYWGYYYDALTDSNYTLVAAPADAAGLSVLRGRLPAAPGECALGLGVAEARAVDVGEDVIFVDGSNTGVGFEVVGVFSAASSVLTSDLVVLTNDDLLAFFGMDAARATDIVVEVRNPSEVATVAAKVKRALPDTRPITRSEILRTYGAVFNWRSGMLMAAFAGAVLAFCILAWDKATGLSAREKEEIGVLKAIGWDTADVLELKFWEGLAVALTALLLGLIAAYLHVFVAGAGLLAPVLKGWSVLFPAFRPTPRVDLVQVLVVAFLTVAPYIASTVIPSWRTATTDPDQVMRG